MDLGLGYDFHVALLLTVPFWIGMLFINGKIILELNREWSIKETKLQEENRYGDNYAENLILQEQKR